MALVKSGSSAKVLGYASLGGSLSFYILGALRLIPGFPGIDLSFNHWVAIWAVSIVLAFVAAAVGSRRWVWAALLPLATFFFVNILLNRQELR
jgi:hypothetical protein